VGPDGQAYVRGAARHRTFPEDGLRAHGNSNYHRRPEGLYQAVASEGTGAPGDGLRRHRSALREQCRRSAPGRKIHQIMRVIGAAKGTISRAASATLRVRLWQSLFWRTRNYNPDLKAAPLSPPECRARHRDRWAL